MRFCSTKLVGVVGSTLQYGWDGGTDPSSMYLGGTLELDSCQPVIPGNGLPRHSSTQLGQKTIVRLGLYRHWASSLWPEVAMYGEWESTESSADAPSRRHALFLLMAG